MFLGPVQALEAIDGLEIGPEVGSCGTAAFHDKTVSVFDIANNPLWANFKDLALQHGLRACWSTPIHGSDGRVLGTDVGGPGRTVVRAEVPCVEPHVRLARLQHPTGDRLRDDVARREVAEAHHVTTAQVLLRWHLDHGFVAIPRWLDGTSTFSASGDPAKVVDTLRGICRTLSDIAAGAPASASTRSATVRSVRVSAAR